LIEHAKKQHYIFADQLPPTDDDLLFLEKYKTVYNLKDGRTIEFRPLMPSDEFNFRNFFYSLEEETIYHRFFYQKRILSHREIQNLRVNVDYHNNMTLIGLIPIGGPKAIVAMASHTGEIQDQYAEVAFVVGENYQRLGIASFMLKLLENIAKENNFIGFTAVVFKENQSMINVFKKHYPELTTVKDDGIEVALKMKFI